MLATEATPTRKGRCCECTAYTRTERTDKFGHKIMWCETHLVQVHSNAPRCDDFDWNNDRRRILSERNEMRRHPEPDTTNALRAPEPQGDRCPRCGGWLRTEGSSIVCCSCWATIVDAERVSYRRPFASALPFLQTTRKWEH